MNPSDEIKCCEPSSWYCCNCRTNCCPGSGGGRVRTMSVNNHVYCYDCYPKMVDVYVAELKLKETTTIKDQEEVFDDQHPRQ